MMVVSTPRRVISLFGAGVSVQNDQVGAFPDLDRSGVVIEEVDPGGAGGECQECLIDRQPLFGKERVRVRSRRAHTGDGHGDLLQHIGSRHIPVAAHRQIRTRITQ